MGPRRRSPGLPPPPQGGFRRDDRRYNNGPPRRRQRSPSPPDRFRRHSPPPFKRGRFNRNEDPGFRYGREPFDRRDRFEDRGGYYRRPPSPPPRQREGPRPYKDFIKTLHDDVTPEEAQQEYQVYLAEFWGSEVRADFEAKRNETWMKEQYDPREMRKAMERRNSTAQATAKAFGEDLKAGLLDPKADDFNQGVGAKDKGDAGDGEEKAADDEEDANDEDEEAKKKPAKAMIAESEEVFAHEVCWKPERVAADLDLSKELILKLDAEKGITVNELVEQPEGKAAEKPETHTDAEDAEKGPQENGSAKEPEQDKDAEAAGKGGEEGEAVGEGYEDKVGKLDLHLTYLWRVHALDYYGGKELANPASYEQRESLSRVLRGPRPEDGEQAPEAEEKKGLKQMDKKVTNIWKKRLASGDPFEAALQTDRVDKQVDDWVEAQVKHIDENKWGSTMSAKLFVGKDYVLKHIRLKHTAAVDAEREKIFDDLYWENYKKAREEQKRLQAEAAAKMQQAAGGVWAGVPMPQGGPMDGFGAVAGSFGADFGGPGPMGPGMPSVLGPPMPPPRRAGAVIMPGGPMPAAGLVLVPAPGAGPMGPFIQVPIAEAGQYGGRPGPPMRGPRPRHPGFGGPPMGYMGPPKMDPRGMREYYDLDKPTNNRAVLDYGDL